MPPPKKPKNGPTTVEQFLSHEELKNMTSKKDKLQAQTSNGNGNGTSSAASDVEGKQSPNSPLPEPGNSGPHTSFSSATAAAAAAPTDNGDSQHSKSSHKLLRKIFTAQQENTVSTVQRSLSSSSEDPVYDCDPANIKIEYDADYSTIKDPAATTVSVPLTGNNSTTPTNNGKMKTMAAVKYLKTREPTPPGQIKEHFDAKQTGQSEYSRTILTTDHLRIYDQSVVRLPLSDTSVSQPSTSSLYSGMAASELPLYSYPAAVPSAVNNEPFDLSVKKNSIFEIMQNSKITLSRSDQFGKVTPRVGILPQGPGKLAPATLCLSQALYLTGSSAKAASSSISPAPGVHLGDVRSSDVLNASPQRVVNLLTNRMFSSDDYPGSSVVTTRQNSSRESPYTGRENLQDMQYG